MRYRKEYYLRHLNTGETRTIAASFSQKGSGVADRLLLTAAIKAKDQEVLDLVARAGFVLQYERIVPIPDSYLTPCNN